MSIAELSSELLRYATETPELSFRAHAPETFVSHEIDVEITRNDGVAHIQIAEPECGDLVFLPLDIGASPQSRSYQHLVQSIAYRRSLLHRVTDAFMALVPDFPATGNQIRMAELARHCDVHITTVSRALDNKKFGTPAGSVAFRRFIAGLT